MLFKHLSSLRMILRWLHNNLSGPEIEALLQFAMAILNSSFENGQPRESWFIDDFIKNINIHLMIESCVESRMKCIPQVINVMTLLTVMFDGFDSGSFFFVDPVHKFPRILFFVSNFLNFEIEEGLFGQFDLALE